ADRARRDPRSDRQRAWFDLLISGVAAGMPWGSPLRGQASPPRALRSHRRADDAARRAACAIASATAMPALETAPPDAGRRRVARFSLITLGYTLLVILFGAVVRITGSGAGCGQHWPTCHGEVAHLPSSVETMIGLTHRVTSGLSLLLVVGVAVLCFRVSAPRDPLRKYALASVGFMLLEAAIGAVLVLLELVGRNDSF